MLRESADGPEGYHPKVSARIQGTVVQLELYDFGNPEVAPEVAAVAAELLPEEAIRLGLQLQQLGWQLQKPNGFS